MKKSLKKKITNRIALILIVAVIIAGIVFLFNRQGEITPEGKQNQTTLEQEKQACKDLGSYVLINACYISLAAEQKDTSICNEIVEGAKDRELCKKEVYVELEDAESCGTMYYVEHKDDCYNRIAQSTGDSSLCEAIADATTKQECLDSF